MSLITGIIVKSIKYKDSSKIIYVITNDGLMSLLVRGANNIKAKNFGYSQILTKISFDYVDGKETKFNILKQAVIKDNFTLLKSDYQKMQISFLILEYAYEFINHIDDKKLFYEFLEYTLKNLTSNNELIYSIIFRLKLLYLLGIGPVFSKCIDCMKDENLIGFSLNKSGMICKSCFKNDEQLFVGNSLLVIRILFLTKPHDINNTLLESLDINFEKINLFLNLYYDRYLGFKSKVEKVIEKMK